MNKTVLLKLVLSTISTITLSITQRAYTEAKPVAPTEIIATQQQKQTETLQAHTEKQQNAIQNFFSRLIGKAPNTNIINKDTYESEKRFKNDFHKYFYAVFSQKKKPRQAFDIFTKLIKTNKYAYKGLINFLHKTENNQKIVALIPLIKQAVPELLEQDPDTGFMIAYALARKDKLINKNTVMPIAYDPQAMDILLKLHKKFPAHQKVAMLIATLYDLNNDPQNALAVSEKYLNRSVLKPTDFLEYFKNAARYIKLKNTNGALKSAKKCIDLQPHFPNGWILLATIYDQQGKTQDAINSCLKALGLTGANRAIEYMIIKLFFKQKKAQHRVTEFVMNKSCFEEAIKLLRNNEHKKALEYIDKCLSSMPANSAPIDKSAPQNDLLRIKLLNNNTKKI